ncbi:polyamine ABC transporter ATP-binding protein [Chitinimonas viridis]|uniref:Spermidine/putrescine import ATP-binding protein PotA n=2 Tax=Chitinimonas TaxID=240411 RepID=A0ABT8B0H6_9NEIS|nr:MULTISPECIES: polyamine ABC transporter ATP-binding protein [Chitinimonas]MDN3575352.1 polyamine ABC transporter ATP-binding protein [Chitinimonas viridis]GLR14778.1 polyamine-transporting ATPase [Chitinimonas prasina]
MAVTEVAAGDNKQHYLEIKGVTKKFGDFYAVDDVDLVIPKNEIFALLGSSGSGKSTLLRMLAGMEHPTEGRIILDGQDITDLQPYVRPVNMMFQSYALFPHMTVEQNIAFGLKQDKLPKDEIIDRVGKMLDLVQMRKYAKRKPHQLSGGQQQRVALARSLAKRPKLLLLDEPLGALDKKLRVQTQFELVNVIETVGVTCIMVTHDQEEAMTMASRIAIMSEGKLMQVGGPREIYEYPSCRFTAEFIGSTNIFEGRLSVDEPDHIVIESPELARGIYVDHGITGPKGMTVWYSVRPEDVVLCREKPDAQYNWAEGKVHDVAYLGSHSVYHVKLASGRIVMANVPSNVWGSEKPATWNEDVVVKWGDDAGVVLTS